jgi:hypothetical protein
MAGGISGLGTANERQRIIPTIAIIVVQDRNRSRDVDIGRNVN